jgi:hypothetical protein
MDASSQSVPRGLLAQQPHPTQNDSPNSASGAKSAALIPSNDPSKDNEKSVQKKEKINSKKA